MGRIVAAGHLNWDVTLRVDVLPDPDGEAVINSQRRSGGGSAANVASALAGFEVPVSLIGSVGDDDHGLLARRDLERAGVDIEGVRIVEGGATTVKYLVVDEAGEVMVLANEGVNEAVGPEDLDEGDIAAAAHLHLTSQRPETARRLVDMARAAGVPVSFDPGRRIGTRGYGSLVDRVDVLFLNDREAVHALPTGEEPEEMVAGGERVIVVKHGKEGATVYAPSGTYSHPGFGIEPVDTTGSGDAFAAGFLATIAGDLSPVDTREGEGDPPGADMPEGDYERALEIANACGALAAREEGARTAPSLEGLRAFLDEQYRIEE